MDKYKTELLVDSHHGQYIPQIFAQIIKREYCKGVSSEDWEILESGPEHESYWDVMIEVEKRCKIYDNEGNVWTLYYNNDLYIVTGDVPEEFYEV